jgi:hypothetical protein
MGRPTKEARGGMRLALRAKEQLASPVEEARFGLTG